MIKTIITMVVTAIAGLIGYLVSDSFRERLAQRQRDKIASEVARGDEAAVNQIKRTFILARHRVKSDWNLVKVTRRGSAPICESTFVRGYLPGLEISIR